VGHEVTLNDRIVLLKGRGQDPGRWVRRMRSKPVRPEVRLRGDHVRRDQIVERKFVTCLLASEQLLDDLLSVRHYSVNLCVTVASSDRESRTVASEA
jgi:hypothetical protein